MSDQPDGFYIQSIKKKKEKMTEEISFIEQLIAESEQKEKKLEQAHLDLILVEIKKLEEQIEKNFDTAAQEIEIIETWALKRNEKLTKRIEWISRKLELYLKNENLKTLDLPNGIIRIRKQPDKIINVDEELFFRKATDDLLNIIPESVKPNLLKIKA